MPLINEGQVVLDLTGVDRHAATRTLAQTLVTSGRCTDIDTFLADVRKREETMATGLPGGIGIPHARSAAITEPSLVFGRIADGIDWGAKDGPAQLIFLIAAPEAGGDAHMQMLPKLARALMKKEFKAALQAATTEAEIVEIVNNAVSLDPAPAPVAAVAPATGLAPAPGASVIATPGVGPQDVAATAPVRSLHFVGVTSCPTGIAHTYMAAEGLERAAKAAGHTITVETQGSAPGGRDRRCGRRDLRARPAGHGHRPVRRQADRRRRRQEGHRRRARARRGSRGPGREMEDRPEPRRGGCCGWRCHERRWRRHGHQGRRERGRRNADPADADERRVLHDSLRCRRRHHEMPTSASSPAAVVAGIP